MKKLVFANWKMNVSFSAAKDYLKKLAVLAEQEKLPDLSRAVFFPPFTSLAAFSEAQNTYQFGGQNCHEKEAGAYTGEISCLFLKDLGCRYLLLGHSERRQLFGETNQSVSSKLR